MLASTVVYAFDRLILTVFPTLPKKTAPVVTLIDVGESNERYTADTSTYACIVVGSWVIKKRLTVRVCVKASSVGGRHAVFFMHVVQSTRTRNTEGV